MTFRLLLGLILFTTISCSEADSSNEKGKNNTRSTEKTNASNMTSGSDDIFKRWILGYGLMNGGKIEGLPPSPAFDYEFNNDGTYKMYQSNGSSISGTWKYDKACECYKLYRPDGELSGQAKLISKNEFVLKPDGKAATISQEGLEYHYKPK